MPVAVAPLAAVDPNSALVGQWADNLRALVERVAPAFARVESRGRALAYLHGLLGPVERKNDWQLAEAAGDATPTACSTCWGGRSGTPTRCGMTCGTM